MFGVSWYEIEGKGCILTASNAAQVIDLAVVAGDGIGPEVISEARKVLRAVLPNDVELRETEYPHSARHYLETGEILSDESMAALAKHDAILLGAIGGDPNDPRLAGGILERGLLLKLRFAFDHYINLRPSKLWPNASSPLANPGNIDFVVVREGTEGLYTGNGGVVRAGTEHEIATEVSVNTAHGVARTVRYAFELARTRRKQLTLVHKKNVLVNAGLLWDRIVNDIAAEYPDVAVDYLHIDAVTIFFVTDPERFDVIVTDNIFGDIITDLAGAVTGGIGLAASGNLNPEGAFPSMFEPVHGSAPDIAGTGKADPTAAILSTALLLRHFGLEEAAARVEAACELDMRNRAGATRTTSEIGDAIVAALA